MNFGICAIFKNEAPYIREWIEFHRMLGAEQFILFDNESTDNYSEEIKDIYEEGIIELNKVTGPRQQLPVYDYVLHTYRDLEWIAFIDLDEFIYSPTGETIPEILDRHKNFRCLQVNWFKFGTSWHKTKPEGLVIDNYTLREKEHDGHFKSIVNHKYGFRFDNPHKCIVNGETITPEELIINHYWTKSEEECKIKFDRGRADTGEKRAWEEFLKEAQQMSEQEDLRLKNLWSDKLNKRLDNE